MPSLIYKGDIGARIVAATQNTTKPPTTTFTIIITKPSGASDEVDGSYNPVTGDVTYITTLATDLDESGQYTAQVHAVDLVNDYDLLSNKDTFTVYE